MLYAPLFLLDPILCTDCICRDLHVKRCQSLVARSFGEFLDFSQIIQVIKHVAYKKMGGVVKGQAL